MRPIHVLCLLLGGLSLAPAALATPGTCIDPAALERVERLDDHAVLALAGGRRYRAALDPDCAGVKPGDPMQLASTSGAICADGKSAVVTTGAICGLVSLEASAPAADACFRIRDVRGFSLLRGDRVGVDLRGGQKRVLSIESGCPQLDRMEGIEFLSGARDGRIYGHPKDAVLPQPGDGMGAGIARQFSANDFRPCRITGVEAVRPMPRTSARGGGTPSPTD